jgi:hypothetical protein
MSLYVAILGTNMQTPDRVVHIKNFLVVVKSFSSKTVRLISDVMVMRDDPSDFLTFHVTSTVEPRFTNLIRSWRPFVNRNVCNRNCFSHKNQCKMD